MNDAMEITKFIFDQTEERAKVLVARLALLVISDRGGPAKQRIDWINDDNHHTWKVDPDES